MRQGNVPYIEILEFNECDYALRYRMYVDGIRAVVKIPDSAILAEEVRAIELEAFTDARIEFGCAERPSDGSQRAEVISGMEIIDPSLRTGFAVIPGSIRVLLGGCIARGL